MEIKKPKYKIGDCIVYIHREHDEADFYKMAKITSAFFDEVDDEWNYMLGDYWLFEADIIKKQVTI